MKQLIQNSIQALLALLTSFLFVTNTASAVNRVRLECPITKPVVDGDSIPIRIFITTDVAISAFSIGFHWDQSAVSVLTAKKGVDFPAGPIFSKGFRPAEQKFIVGMVYMDPESWLDPVTDAHVATFYLRVPIGTPPMCVNIDSSIVGPAGYFIFSPTAGGSISPEYVDCGTGDIKIAVTDCGQSNDPPVVTNIPNQTIAEGASFSTIKLDDFVSDVDNTDAAMTWTYSGNSQLSVSIVDRVATISAPNLDWNGNETITFKATDPGGLFSSDSAIFTVTSVNDPPVGTDKTVTATEDVDYPVQAVDFGFTDPNDAPPNNFLSVVITSLPAKGTLKLSGVNVTPNQEILVSDINANNLKYHAEPNQNGTSYASLQFRVRDNGGTANGGIDLDVTARTMTINVTAVNDPPVVTDIPNQTIAEGASFSPINLDDFVSDIDTTDAAMTWTYSGNSQLSVSIVDRVATISAPNLDWNGNETITFKATDPGGLSDSDTAMFSIAAPTPIIKITPDTLTFTAYAGGANPANQAVMITNIGNGALDWAATETTPWLSLSYTSGAAPSEVTVYIDITSLPAGTYAASVSISSAQASNSPRILVVRLNLYNPSGPKITANAGANGSISPSGIIPVNSGGSQTFTITPDPGYHVLDVTVDDVSAGALASYTFTNVIQSHTINATFAINQYTLTPTSSANGSISPAIPVTVDYGGSQTFTITPETGFHVLDVTVDGVSQGAAISYTFTNVTKNHTINATFAINQYTLTPTWGLNGSIIPATPVTVNYGGSQTFEIKPNQGYHVLDVTVDGVSAGAITSYMFTKVAADHEINATFAINPIGDISVTIKTEPPGRTYTINGVAHSEESIFSWQPNTTHRIAVSSPQQLGDSIKYEWLNWDDQKSQSHEVTPTTDTVYTARFKTYYWLDVRANPSAGGMVTPTSKWDSSGAIVQIRAIPNSGYAFQVWQGTGVGSSSRSNNPDTIVLNNPIKEIALFSQSPVIVCDADSFVFTAFENGDLPPAQLLHITNRNSSGTTLHWEISKDSNWLDVHPTGPDSSNSAEITASVTTTAKLPGYYIDTIRVTSDNASNSPRLIPVTYTVKALTLDSITISPDLTSVAAGDSVRFSALGKFTDEHTSQLEADSLVWESSDANVAKLVSPGLVEALKQGSVTISASKDSVTGNYILTVDQARLREIQVTSRGDSLARGDTMSFFATGTYTDNSVLDVTSSVTWSTSNSDKASVTSTGFVTGEIDTGLVVINATSREFPGIEGSRNLTITRPKLIGIIVPRDSIKDTVIAAGGTINLQAIGKFTDGKSGIVTDSAVWSSSNSAVATVTGGIVTGISIGEASIRATASGYSDAILVTVAVALDGSGDITQDAGQATTVKVNLRDPSLATGKLFHRVGGDGLYLSGETVYPNGGSLSFTIPGANLGLRGVEYYVEIDVGDNHLIITQPANGPKSQPYQLRSKLLNVTAEVELPTGSSQDNYRIIGFPYQVGPNDCDSVFNDDFGVYNNQNWRLYHWDPVNRSNVEYTNPNDTLEWKRGYWLISRNKPHYTASGISAIPDVDTLGKRWAKLDLLQGWNQISTPFAFDISWNGRFPNDSVGSIVEWKTGFSSVDVLKPFCGYFVEATANTTLLLPYEQSPAGTSKLRARNKAAESKSGWEVRLVMRCEGAQDSYNVIGAHNGAADGFDPSDFGEPPSIGSYISLAFPGLYPDGARRLLAGDFRSLDHESWEYDLIVKGNISASPELAYYPTDNNTDSVFIELHDADGKLLRCLKPGVSVGLDVPSTDEGNHYRLVVKKTSSGSDDVNSTNSSLPALTLMQNYPNPFNVGTRISFDVPVTSDVSVEIKNILGQKIKSYSLRELPPGTHFIDWDGADQRGLSVSSGVYLYQVVAGVHTESRKMLLLK